MTSRRSRSSRSAVPCGRRHPRDVHSEAVVAWAEGPPHLRGRVYASGRDDPDDGGYRRGRIMDRDRRFRGVHRRGVAGMPPSRCRFGSGSPHRCTAPMPPRETLTCSQSYWPSSTGAFPLRHASRSCRVSSPAPGRRTGRPSIRFHTSTPSLGSSTTGSTTCSLRLLPRRCGGAHTLRSPSSVAAHPDARCASGCASRGSSRPSHRLGVPVRTPDDPFPEIMTPASRHGVFDGVALGTRWFRRLAGSQRVHLGEPCGGSNPSTRSGHPEPS